MNKKQSISVLVVVLFLLGYFIVREKQVTLVVVDPITHLPPVQQVVKLVDGRQCYIYNHDATPTDPYTTTDFMDITITGNKVTGVRHGTQIGPDMTNGYAGTMEGTLENDKIIDVFSYTVEGSKNKEREIFQAENTGLDKLRYQLIDSKDILIPDTTKSFTILKYSRAPCDGSN